MFHCPVRCIRGPAAASAALAALAVSAAAASPAPAMTLPQKAPEVAERAPPIELELWLNTDEPLTLDKLRGRVVMVEFWGTWCGPCVRAMPHVQELHDRYRDKGLTVIAISYEMPAQMSTFLTENAYTMPVGSDPEKTVVNAYGVRSWPTTFVIDKAGKIAYAGGPYAAEAAIEKELGLESSPASLLTGYLSVLAGKDKQQRRDALERLLRKAPPDFDLRAWAAAVGGAGAAGSAAELDGAVALTRCAAAWRKPDPEQRQAVLDAVATAAPRSYDLGSWARAEYGKQFPLDSKELTALLAAGKHEAVVDAVLLRNPSGSMLKKAQKDAGLVRYCRQKASGARELARKGVMIQYWLFGEYQLTEAGNQAFWGELSVSGVQTSKDRKRLEGVLIGGKAITRAMANGFIDEQLGRAIVMEAMQSGDTRSLETLDKSVAKARDEVVEDLAGRYGKEPRKDGGG